MKKCMIILMVVFFFGTILYAQNGFYYYKYKDKKPLERIDQTLIIKFQRSQPTALAKEILETFNLIDRQSVKEIAALLYRADRVTEKTFAEVRVELLKLNSIESVHPLFKTREEGAELYLNGEICLQFLNGTTETEISRILETYELEVIRALKIEPYYLVKSKRGSDVLSVANRLAMESPVLFSHPNFYTDVLVPLYIPDDRYFSRQFNFHNTGQGTRRGTSTPGADIKVVSAWDITLGSSQIQVTVIDDGLDLNHEDIASQKIIAGYDFADHDDNVQPVGENAHGTHCSGLIAADHNSIGIVGISPNSKLQMMKIFDDNGYGGSNDDVARAIDSARTQGSDVISNSWAYQGVSDTNYVPAVRQAILRAKNLGRNGQGCVVVFAASNTANRQSGDVGVISFPASMSQVITVGASDRNDAVSFYSPNSMTSQNIYLDLVATSHRAYEFQVQGEGFEIWSTDIMGSAGYNPGTQDTMAGDPDGNYSGDFGGTSAACPQVSGAAALILAINPNLTAEEVRDVLNSTADTVGGYNYNAIAGRPGASLELGYGRLDVYNALTYVQGYQLTFQFMNRIQESTNYGHLIVDQDVNNTVPSGGTRSFDNGTNHEVRTAELPFITNWQGGGTTQKHHRFYETSSDYSLNHQFQAVGGEPFVQDANFMSTEAATIKTDLISGGQGDTIYFRDPWRYYQDGGGNWQQSNQFISYPSPLNIENDDISDYGGVFLNQSGPQHNWDPPYYSVRADQQQIIPFHGQNIKWYFQNWSGTDVQFQHSNQNETAVVFQQANAVAKANYKGHLASSTYEATSNNNGRRMVQDSEDNLHCVYLDANNVWYTYSDDGGETWTAEELVDEAGTSPEAQCFNPSITVLNGKVYCIYTMFWDVDDVTWFELRYSYKTIGQANWTAVVLEYIYDSINNIPNPVISAGDYNGEGYLLFLYSMVNPQNHKREIHTKYKKGNDNVTTIGQVFVGDKPSIDGNNDLTQVKFMLAYENESNIYTRYWNWPELMWGEEACATSDLWMLTDCRSPSLSFYNYDGYLTFEGISEVAPNEHIYYRKLHYKSGFTFFDAYLVSEGSSHPSISGDYTNGVSIFFKYFRYIEYSGYIYKKYYDGDIWLSEQYGLGRNPSVIVSGDALAAWTKEESLPYLVIAAVPPSYPSSEDSGKDTLKVDKRLSFTFQTNTVNSYLALDIRNMTYNGKYVQLDTLLYSAPLTSQPGGGELGFDIGYITKNLTAGINPEEELLRVILFTGHNILPIHKIKLKDVLNLHLSPVQVHHISVRVPPLTTPSLRFALAFGNLKPNVIHLVGSPVGTLNNEMLAADHNVQTNLVPDNYQLYHNYPNPFNPTTTITFDLPEEALVKLAIYDVTGRQIRTITNARYQAGSHRLQWDGKDEQGNMVASGVYVYRLVADSYGEAGNYTQTRKMMLLK